MARKAVAISTLFFGSIYASYTHSSNLNQVFAREKIVQTKNLKLKQVQVIFRHGARAPITSVKCMPDIIYGPSIMTHPEHTFVPYKLLDNEGNPFEAENLSGSSDAYFGQLTGAGAQQLFDLGTWLRRRYVDDHGFISCDYAADEVEVSSTKMKRTVESARSMLSGLYPEVKEEIPIAIHAVEKDEILSPSFKTCDYLKVVSQMSWANTDCIKGMRNVREELQELLNVCEDDKTFHIVMVRDHLFSHKFHGVLPAKFDYPRLMKLAECGATQVMDYVFCGSSGGHSDRILQLCIGRLVQLMLDNLDAATSCGDENKKAKMMLYAGHDTSLFPLLNILGIYDGKWPPFASHIVIELLEDTSAKNDYYIKVLFNTKPQSLPGCIGDVVYRLSDFRRVLEKFALPQAEYEKECTM